MFCNHAAPDAVVLQQKALRLWQVSDLVDLAGGPRGATSTEGTLRFGIGDATTRALRLHHPSFDQTALKSTTPTQSENDHEKLPFFQKKTVQPEICD